MRRGGRLALFVLLLIVVIALRLWGVGELLTLENVRESREAVEAIVRESFGKAVAAYIALYIAVTAFSIPGAAVLSLAGGFFFGTAVAFVCVNAGATTGATLAFLSARYLLGGGIQKRYEAQLKRFNAELERNGHLYMLTLRLIPAFPFFLINILSGLTKIPLGTFIWTTSVGIMPGSLAYTFAGSRLGTIKSAEEVFSGKVIAALLLLAAFTLAPVIIKKARRKRDG